MPQENNVAALGTKPGPLPTPEVGQTVVLQFQPYGGLHAIYGDQYYKDGIYVEVEVKAVKTAKIVLE